MALTLTLKNDEAILMDGRTRIAVKVIGGGKVRLRVETEPGIRVLREQIAGEDPFDNRGFLRRRSRKPDSIAAEPESEVAG